MTGTAEEPVLSFDDRYASLAQKIGGTWKPRFPGEGVLVDKAGASVVVSSHPSTVRESSLPVILDFVAHGNDARALSLSALPEGSNVRVFVVEGPGAKHILYGSLLQAGVLVTDNRTVVEWRQLLSEDVWLYDFVASVTALPAQVARFEPFTGTVPTSRPFMHVLSNRSVVSVTQPLCIRFVLPATGIKKLRIPVAEVTSDAWVDVSLEGDEGRVISKSRVNGLKMQSVGALEHSMPASLRAGAECALRVVPKAGKLRLLGARATYPLMPRSDDDCICAFELIPRRPFSEVVRFMISRSAELVRRGEYGRLFRAAVIRAGLLCRRLGSRFRG